MDKIVTAATKVPEHRNDDDFVDRLNNRYTVMVLIVFAIVVSSQLYIGKPITCWADKHFTGNHIKYTNAYCWVKNTYYLNFEDEIPKEHEEGKRRTIIYYQWMPFILLGQALFFFLPSTIWNGLNQKAGVDCDNILVAAGNFSKAEKENKRKTLLRLITNQMDRFLDSRVDMVKSGMPTRAVMAKLSCGICGRRMGNYLCILYIFHKMLYVVNVLGQLFILNSILKTKFSVYGAEFLNNVMSNEHWTNTPAFPRVTMCDFKVRRLGNVQRYSVQCVLPINMYTEKIYVFLWFWMVFIALMTSFSLVTWMARILMPGIRMNYVKNHLRIASKLDSSLENKTRMLEEFTYNFLRSDGIFILRLIGHNTNSITVTDILAALWEHWRDKVKKDPSVDPSAPIDEPDSTLPLKLPAYHQDLQPILKTPPY